MRGSATFITATSRTSMSWAMSTIAIPVAARPELAGRAAGKVWDGLWMAVDRSKDPGLNPLLGLRGRAKVSVTEKFLGWRRLYGDTLRFASEVGHARRCPAQPRAADR